MNAPTSPKPPTPADLTVSKDAPATLDKGACCTGLRTALTNLADEGYSLTCNVPAGTRFDSPHDAYAAGWTDAEYAARDHLRALLAAHPAPECGCDESQSETCPQHGRSYSEWVERGDNLQARLEALTAPVSDTRREDDERVEVAARALSRSDHPGVQAYIDARAVLAVLPAPPVVDEAEIADAVLARYSSFDPLTARGIADVVAARLRGADRG